MYIHFMDNFDEMRLCEAFDQTCSKISIRFENTMGHDIFSAPSVTAQGECYCSQLTLTYPNLTEDPQADNFYIGKQCIQVEKKI